ncbi:MAG: hydantoinase B/oxoprolinase family protein [Planctomycetota bacterium]|jgi:5-oxoprolinase (ATP-hydrolysing)|nr:hydantoinase B/oxoprolinase family protein [Planctomycetota bacterium]
MSGGEWEFWIDVGGTFTDCLGISPQGEVRTCKILSSGRLQGVAGTGSGFNRLVDSSRNEDSPDFYRSAQVRIFGEGGKKTDPVRVVGFDSGIFELSEELPGLLTGARFEIVWEEEAPVVGIRKLLGCPLHEVSESIRICLGTTRGTNALLERKGVGTAFVTTRGFADILRIGTQDRPRLFDLEIHKPEALEEEVVELDERVAADGTVLRVLDREEIRRALAPVRGRGIASLAVCLMNAYRNDVHERTVARVARELGFEQVSISSAISPTIGIVPRGDTTVVDAYLTPVLSDYIASIRASLPAATLLCMTNAGGLVEAGRFSGKDSLLSGPAGGVVGLARTAREIGLEEVIGFDMGGTSTDVSRWGGRAEIHQENETAGVRISTPMIAIETVAAGGGSILSFDGHRLRVGPESAGADPGPACYGQGGPITLTDANVHLGRVPGDHFPFALDLEAVQKGFERLAGQIEEQTGKRWDEHDLAEGYLRIACQNMAAPIRKISIARGYDVREHALVAFGGAGPQHACALARHLGMKQVVIHPYAGILSAYGIGLADLRKYAQRPVLADYDAGLLGSLEGLFFELEQALRKELLEEGAHDSWLRPSARRLGMHYVGGGSSLAVDLNAGEDPAEQFELLHQQFFGHHHSDRGLVVEWMGVEQRASKPDRKSPATGNVSAIPEPIGSTEIVGGGELRDYPIFRREDLPVGHCLVGPVLILDPFSTLLVDPGWQLEVHPTGSILLTDSQGRARTEEISTEVDPLQLEIFHNHFASIAEEMGVTLRRAALSTNVRERLDFSCALFTSEGGLVVNAPHIPVHLGAMSETIRCLLREVKRFEPGDVYLTNDPFRGGSHLPDLTVVTPVFDRAGSRLLFFSASRAHHAEIGGTRPGSMPPDSTTLAEEGVLIRHFRLIQAGQPNHEELRELLTTAPYPSRSPKENLADIDAQVAAGARGARGLLEMIDRYGEAVVLAYMDHIQAASAAKTRAALRRLGDGVYRFTDTLDDGTPITVRIEVTDGDAVVDFTGSGPVHPGNLNANRSIVTAAVLYTFRVLLDEDIPLNGGVLDPVELIVPEGILAPPAQDDPVRCPAVAGGNVETSQRIVDVLLGALGLAAASQGTMNNLLFGDATFGYYETIAGGAGAGEGFEGASGVHTHMTNTRLTDAEVLEARYPVRVCRFGLRNNSGGAGKHPGGDGVLRELEFLAELEVSLLTQRRLTSPYGLEGGEPGAAGRNVFCPASGGKRLLDPIESLRVGPGDRIRLQTPGGGGYGAPEVEGV